MIFFSLSSKSVFFTKLAISFFLAKFSCDNLAAKYSDVNFDIYIHIFFWYIYYGQILVAIVVAKLVILSISFSNSFILALRVVLVAKLATSGILSSILLQYLY